MIEIRGETISYASKRNKNVNNNYNKLLEDISILETNDENNNLLEEKKQLMDNLESIN